MTDADPEVINRVNRLAESRFQLEVERETENQRFNEALASLTKEHEERLRIFTERERVLDPALWKVVDENRAGLIAPKKRSFATMLAKFQLKDVPAKTEVVDKQGIMEIARKLGVIRQIANPPKGEWRFNQKKLFGWLAKNGEFRRHFEPFLNEVDKDESLTISPNRTYTVEHDSQRISPPSITIKKIEGS